jgi:hypothetical protein
MRPITPSTTHSGTAADHARDSIAPHTPNRLELQWSVPIPSSVPQP